MAVAIQSSGTVKKRGGTKGKLQLQPGAVIVENQDGSFGGTATWKGDVAFYSTRIKRGDPHPLDKNLSCFSIKTTFGGNSNIVVEADFIGLDQDPSPYFLEYVGSMGEAPLDTHPHFVDAIGGTPDVPLHGAVFDADTGEFLGFPANAPNHLGGVTNYYQPSVIIRASYWTKKKPNLGALGHIVDPRTIAGVVLPTDSLDLLVINLAPRQVGAIWQVTVEMLASGPNGWNDLIYYY